MKRDALIKLLAFRLGDRDLDEVSERAVLEMDFVQRMTLEEHEWLPWFLESELASIVTEIGENRVPVPLDFLLEIEEEHLYVVDSAGTALRLVKGDADTLQAKYSGTGQPQCYAISGKYYLLFPTPDAVYGLQQRYYAADTLMSAADEETSWLKYAADLVLAVLGQILAGKHYKDTAAEASFKVDAEAAWNRLYTKHTAMAEINQSRSMGGNS
jgi:hypothetical protein